MTAPSFVRIAKPDDKSEIWRLLLLAHRENSLFDIALDKVEWFINRLLLPELIPSWDTGPRGAIGVIGPIGSLEAIVLVGISDYWYSYRKHLEEFIVFTDPEHRCSNHARALIEWMKEQVELTKLPLMTGVLSNHRTEAKCRLYRQLLPKVGEFFFVSPKGVDVRAEMIRPSSSAAVAA